MASTPAPSPRTQVRRLPDRGAYDRDTVYGILDAAFLCHVGFASENGPVVIPTAYGRRGDQLYLHGSAANHMLRTLDNGATGSDAAGIEACVTVTILDGLVLARSVFHHSMNYRSVMVFGRAMAVRDEAEKLRALETITNQIVPGRWGEARAPNAKEMKGTLVLALPLAEASAKIRTGPPKDEEADYELPVWAGVVPAKLAFAAPVADPRLGPGIALAASAERRGR